jgi:tRNA threonylcarbamoyl adenosine modification protein YeaZ
MEISIDTSTRIANIAISEEGSTLADTTWIAGQNHTVGLLPKLNMLFRQTETTVKSIQAVFVAIGPGSYNGLRVALSTTKGLAFALNIPVVGVSTLEIEAYPFAFTGLPLCPIHDAARHELAVALYQQRGSDWLQLEKEHLTTAEGLSIKTATKTLFCGEIPPDVVSYLASNLKDLAVIPDDSARTRRAKHLATIGWIRLQQGERHDIATLQPTYPRRPHITIPKSQA